MKKITLQLHKKRNEPIRARRTCNRCRAREKTSEQSGYAPWLASQRARALRSHISSPNYTENDLNDKMTGLAPKVSHFNRFQTCQLKEKLIAFLYHFRDQNFSCFPIPLLLKGHERWLENNNFFLWDLNWYPLSCLIDCVVTKAVKQLHRHNQV